jgi:hypothetical protein
MSISILTEDPLVLRFFGFEGPAALTIKGGPGDARVMMGGLRPGAMSSAMRVSIGWSTIAAGGVAMMRADLDFDT